MADTIHLESVNSKSPHQTKDVELNGSFDISLTQHFSDVIPMAVASNIRTPVFNSDIPVLCSPNDTRPDNTISRYLVPPPLSMSTSQTLRRARLLTSTAALDILNEKECKNQEAAALKEQKRNREEMKQKKQEEQRRKAEERAKKVEQRAR